MKGTLVVDLLTVMSGTFLGSIDIAAAAKFFFGFSSISYSFHINLPRDNCYLPLIVINSDSIIEGIFNLIISCCVML
jgi:hypothetical protein